MSMSLPNGVTVAPGPNGLSRLLVSTAQASAEVYRHGAHVTAWQPSGAAPILWLSRDSRFSPEAPIRGGVPICFPWFAAHPSDAGAPMHGFARLADWELSDAQASADAVHLTFSLRDDERSRRSVWPHAFRAEFRVAVGRSLTMALDIANPGERAISFEAALHTYFVVGDIRRVHVTGLEQTEYLDKVDGFARKPQGAHAVTFAGETDRIYLDTDATCVIHDAALERRIEVAKTGSHSTVVWNPWADRARAMPDFGDDQWTEMLCIETANVRDRAVALEPGSHHTMTATIRLA